jgi:hypothetical protein
MYACMVKGKREDIRIRILRKSGKKVVAPMVYQGVPRTDLSG